MKTDRYDFLQFLSQRENGEVPQENEDLVSLANDLRRAVESSARNEGQSCNGNENVTTLNAIEKKCAEDWAKSNGCWIPFTELFNIGVPGPCGSECDTYISADGFVYKMNNLLHCYDSIMLSLEKFILHNIIFPDCAYVLVGFTGFGNQSVYPLVRQQHIRGGKPAMQNEIDCYMAAIGFEKNGNGSYHNNKFMLSDVLPKNVLKDDSGDLYVIDAEISFATF